MLFNGGMVYQTLVHPHHEILPSNKYELIIDTHKHDEFPGNYAEL